MTKKTLATVCGLITALGNLSLSAVQIDTSLFSKSLRITVPDTSMAAGVSLSDIPVLVRLSHETRGFSYDGFLAGGADLAFADSSGNMLPYEIDTWNTNGESLVWVKLPVLERGASFAAYWGAASATANTPADVWSGYAGVWHCNEANGALADSTGNGNSATPVGHESYVAKMVSSTDAAIGTARTAQPSSTYFDGWAYKSSHFVTNAPSLRINSQLVFSGWFKAKEVVGTLRCASSKTDYTSSDGWEIEFPDDIRHILVRGGGQGAADIPNPINAEGRYIYYVVAFDGTTASCYTNGHLSASGTVRQVTASDAGLGIGNNAACSERGWCGLFDEVRYRAGTISAAMVEAEYRMVAEKDFLQYGEETSNKIDPALFAKAVMFTINQNYADASIADVPVLVRLSTAISGFSYSDFQAADDSDLCFADENGVILPHDVDEWNTSGESLVWVKLPSGAAGTKITAYYGSATWRNASGTAVWSDYTGVWHMNEASGNAIDATGNGGTGVPTGALAAGMVGVNDGAVGIARKNCPEKQYGAAGSCLSITGSENWGLGDTFTASGFFRITSENCYPVRWFRLFSTKYPSVGGGWGQETDGEVAGQIYVYGGGDASLVDISPSFFGNWVHLAFVYSGRSCGVYANGTLLSTAVIDAARDNGKPLSLGSNSDCSEWCLYGDYDEVRIQNAAPGAAEIAFTYNAMAQTDFFTASAVETVASATVSVTKLSDAAEENLVSGVFRVSRPSAAAYAAFADYSLSGTAVEGLDYSTPRTGIVAIPAGSAYADFAISPLHNAASSDSKTVTITLDGGATATMTIANLAPPTKRDFRRSIDFTVSAPFLGVETLADFPVLVRLSTAISGFSYEDFKKAGGGDMLFVDRATGNAIPHAVDEWNTNGESLVWVMVPQLSDGKAFRMYFASGCDLGGAVKGAPWKGYTGVWHFNEGTWEKPAYDATGHGLDAVVNATLYPDHSGDYAPGGAVGKARWNQDYSQDDGGKNWYEVGYCDALDLGREFVFSGWFKLNAHERWPRIISRKDDAAPTFGWEVEVDSATAIAAWKGNNALSATVPDLSSGWTHLAFAYGRDAGEGKTATLEIYANGEKVESGDGGAARYYGRPLAFGCSPAGSSFPFNGAFDEFRYRGGTVSANWVKAEYATVKNAAFLSADSVQSLAPATMIYVQ